MNPQRADAVSVQVLLMPGSAARDGAGPDIPDHTCNCSATFAAPASYYQSGTATDRPQRRMVVVLHPVVDGVVVSLDA